MPTPDAILRASGKLTVLRGRRPGKAIEYGKRQRPPCRKGLIRRTRQHHDGRLAEAPDGRGAAGLQGNAMAKNFAARRQCVTAASVRPTPEPPTIRSRSCAPSSSAAAIDAASRPTAVKTVSAAAACALSAISSAVTLSPGTLTMHSRGRRTFNRSIRQHAPSGDRAAARAARPSRRDSPRRYRRRPAARPAPGPPPPAPAAAARTNRRNQDQHAVASLRDGLAGLDPDRRGRQRQRRIRRRADEIAGAKGVAVRRGSVARRIGRKRRHAAAMQRSASLSVNSNGATGSNPFSRASSAMSSGVSEVGGRWGKVMARLCPESGRK